MTREQIAEMCLEHMLLFADGFDDAIIGVSHHWSSNSRIEAVAYDYNKCVEILMERDGMDYEGAVEFLEFNTLGAYMGEHTPVFIQTGE
jgi:hypothetical protein